MQNHMHISFHMPRSFKEHAHVHAKINSQTFTAFVRDALETATETTALRDAYRTFGQGWTTRDAPWSQTLWISQGAFAAIRLLTQTTGWSRPRICCSLLMAHCDRLEQRPQPTPPRRREEIQGYDCDTWRRVKSTRLPRCDNCQSVASDDLSIFYVAFDNGGSVSLVCADCVERVGVPLDFRIVNADPR